MPLSKSIHMYHDIQSALIAAREAGGAVCRLESANKAISWRQRAYYYRKLLAENDERAHPIPGYVGSTEWDDMTLTIEASDPTGVRIEFGVVKGKLESLGGSPLARPTPAAKLSRKKPTTVADADLLAAAEGLAMEIDKG